MENINNIELFERMLHILFPTISLDEVVCIEEAAYYHMLETQVPARVIIYEGRVFYAGLYDSS